MSFIISRLESEYLLAMPPEDSLYGLFLAFGPGSAPRREVYPLTISPGYDKLNILFYWSVIFPLWMATVTVYYLPLS